MNKSIAIFCFLAIFAVAVARATVGVGYRSTYYQAYPYPGYAYGPNYAPYYRGYSVQAGAMPAYSPYYAPYYGASYYGPSYYGYGAPYAKA